MLHTAHRARSYFVPVLTCGLMAGALWAVGCSKVEESSPSSAKAEHSATAAAPAEKPLAAKAAPALASEAARAGAALKEASAETAKVADNVALKAGDAAQKAAAAAQAASTEKAKSAAADAKSAGVQAPQPKLAEVIKPEAAGLKPAVDPAALKPVDPKVPADPAVAAKLAENIAQDVDPNSKAKLTYEFGTDTKNFGKVMQGDVLNHTFDLSSSGEEDLIIKQAKPTCGCTVAQIMAQQADGTMAPYAFGGPIAPGRKVQINATLHTQNKRGHAGSRINIFTNDPRGQTQLGLEAEVEPYFQVNPNVINFNQLSTKDTASDKATISTSKGERVTLSAVTDNMPQGLKVELKPLDGDPEGKATRWELGATAGPGLVEGNLAYSVSLKSDVAIPGGEKLPNGNMPTYEVQITVMGRVTGMIEYNPAFVSLGLIRPGQALSRSVKVTSHDADFKLNDVKVGVQGRDSADWEYKNNFSTVVRPVTGENAIEVEITLTGMPEALNGSFSGNLVIAVGHPQKPEIKLPITGVCRGGAPPVADPAGQVAPK